MSGTTTMFRARKIITMHPAVPEATHVAVREGRILEVGSREACESWGPATLDDRFADSVLIPGLIESHAHMMEGALWAIGAYVGAIDRVNPTGRRCNGLRTIPAVVQRLKEIEPTMADPAQPLVGWGVDPSFYPTADPITRHDLDQVSTTRPILELRTTLHCAPPVTDVLTIPLTIVLTLTHKSPCWTRTPGHECPG